MTDETTAYIPESEELPEKECSYCGWTCNMEVPVEQETCPACQNDTLVDV